MRSLRIVLLLLLVLLGWLQYRLWFGSGGQREVAALRAQVHRQQRDNSGLQQRNDALAAEVEDLKSGEAAVEERARNELGMIKPGETFYRVVEPEAADTPAGADASAGAESPAAPGPAQ
jgi:cell division protein FtsB